MTTRREEDELGPVEVPAAAYFGAQTMRAAGNFPISGLHLPAPFLRALALIKCCTAGSNRDLGLLDAERAGPIMQAAREIIDGSMHDQFVVDVFQTGSGTSTNMNMNEVIAGRANELLTGRRGGRAPVHPNDHVNRGQSSNDVIPSAISIAACVTVTADLLPALQHLLERLQAKARAFAGVRKIGRTHGQDALPVTLGQEFSGYAAQLETGMASLAQTLPLLSRLALGGTAVGTGAGAHPRFAELTIAAISRETGLSFHETSNHFAAQAGQEPALALSGALRVVATALAKSAADLRLLSSGPRCGLGEIVLPALQPGSSIMPGKVNPVIPEVVLQVAAQVHGNDAAIAAGAGGGLLELNTMLPLIAHNLLQSIELLGNVARVYADRCIEGLQANTERCMSMIGQSTALAALAAPVIGHDRAAAIAREAARTGKSVREIILSQQILSAEEFDRLLGA